MIDFFITPLAYPFVVKALIAVTVVASVCALVGTFVVLRGMSYIGAALSHSLTPGIAIGYLLNGPSRNHLFWWATITAVIASLGMVTLVRRSRLAEDTAVGIVYAGMFALGIAIISSKHSFSVDLLHFLFGNILSITSADLVRIGIVSTLIFAVIIFFYKELVLVSFDRTFALSLRIKSTQLTYLQFLLVALAIVVALQTIGIALVITLIVAPPAAALQFTHRFHYSVLAAAIIGISSGIVGIYLSYHINIASGASVALVCVSVFLVVSVMKSLIDQLHKKKNSWNAVPRNEE